MCQMGLCASRLAPLFLSCNGVFGLVCWSPRTLTKRATIAESMDDGKGMSISNSNVSEGSLDGYKSLDGRAS